MAFIPYSTFAARPLLARRASSVRFTSTQPPQHPMPVVAVSKRSVKPPQQTPPPLSAMDSVSLMVENVLVLYGNRPARDATPVAQGDLDAVMGDKPFFLALHNAFLDTGPIYKLAFGPKVFIVIQDPVIARSVLRENSILYDKGILAEILEDVMGKGLIPADYNTWKIRRRAILPGFHSKWLQYMTIMFASSANNLCTKLNNLGGNEPVDMETEYSSLTLDIIGKAVFNFDFDSINSESPIIKAVYRCLKETEHRSMMAVPYWKIPGARKVVPRLRRFYGDMDLINDTLNVLIESAKRKATAADLSELESRDYENVADPSLLRFLVELRGEETTNKQLRDDLMTLLIAGHETTAAVLTWATAELAKHPEIMRKAREEIETVLGDRLPTYKDVAKLPYIRRIIAETLRLYPAPPVLIRRLLEDTTLPKGGSPEVTNLPRGSDIFINVYSLHRSPALWDDPEIYDPDRWLKPKSNPGVEGWAGYKPASGLEEGTPLYPNEVNADFAFLPFGGGSRKCVGDHFAVLESVVALAMVIRQFDFVMVDPSKDVEMTTGATIHTKNGLNMFMVPRHSASLTDGSIGEPVEIGVPSFSNP
ncbi:cytochrome P450 family 97G-CYP97G1 [Chondrus crispus]|uniref:Cytochrome P450 family 97G-CYP97G1 n=1 Tax=Chondrus crispus TaxID=2769 RepID=R7QA48_CHOCR|nr:cytochrome P450 family 97G-CYP97G1 [Chondrus crispus]CDF35397.1 cytochrome P450 family 97G-CYP97G1 [Chondrus crispus]|eukprot:XP_005715216.1 cytochrome P450 family 97G-CYP97G1 [Chondrus crispus]